MARPDLSYLKNVLLFLFGLPLGLLTGLSGIAASVFVVPGSRALLGLHPARAIGTGLVVTFCAALASLPSYGQHQYMRGWLAVILLVGLSIGKRTAQRISVSGPVSPSLHWLWGTLLTVGGLSMTAQGLGLISVPSPGLFTLPAATHDLLFYAAALALALLLGAGSHWMGLGAELVVPAEIYLLGLTAHPAIGTALLVLVLASLPGVLVLLRHGQIEPQSATWLSFGGVLGGLTGALWALSFSQHSLILLYGLLLTVLGVMRLWKRDEAAAANIGGTAH